ncbi:hypothetical protein KSP40_PGU011637 [Platanthera guangdongensis]|uniref:Uncharacterized protein n=1 Tax=Platanthera guangdongensis TaxID=2320717 RepID=A0ABR2M4N7_9ASPA
MSIFHLLEVVTRRDSQGEPTQDNAAIQHEPNLPRSQIPLLIVALKPAAPTQLIMMGLSSYPRTTRKTHVKASPCPIWGEDGFPELDISAEDHELSSLGTPSGPTPQRMSSPLCELLTDPRA